MQTPALIEELKELLAPTWNEHQARAEASGLVGLQRLKTLNLKYQKRLIRPEYAQTQATPYAATLDPSLRNTDGSIRVPLAADTTPFTRSANAFTLNNSLVPGSVMVRTSADLVAFATGGNTAEMPFGLLGNFVGGDLDDLGTENPVGVWRGPDSVYTLLAPAWTDTGLASAYSSATAGIPVPLYPNTDSRLIYLASPGNRVQVARLIDRPAASRIVIDLIV